MGNRISSVQNNAELKARSDEIDRLIEEDNKRYRKDCKILILGSSESGKSTIVKQMKIHQNGFTPDELATYRHTIYQNVLDSAQALIHAMRKLNVDCIEEHNRLNTEKILGFRLDPAVAYALPCDVAQAIHELWVDPVIPTVMDEHGSEFCLMDSASYFFTEVLRIGAVDYRPTETDVLHARLKSTGITETRFNMGQLSIRIFNVSGQHSWPKKWIHCFEGVTSIIFCTALSDYDHVLPEGENQSRMAESLMLFDKVVNSRWFLHTSIILFLNKIDVFKNKLPKVPLANYFPEYTGGDDVDKAAKYILWRFMQLNCARLNVYPHLTQATAATSNLQLIFAAIKETMLLDTLKKTIPRKMLRNSQIL